MFTRLKRFILENKYFSVSRNAGYKTNAYTPLIWITSTVMASLCLLCWHLEDGWLRFIIGILIVAIIVFSFGVYLYLLLNKPHLLQSERYRTDDKILNIISQHGGEIKLMDEQGMSSLEYQKSLEEKK